MPLIDGAGRDMSAALDRYLTTPPEPEPDGGCPECGHGVFVDDHEFECEGCGFVGHENDVRTACENPGPRGCQNCDACEEWADQALDRQREEDW